MKIDLCLPFPPSMNTYWRTFRGIVVLSKQGREYKNEVRTMVIEEKIPAFGDRRLAVKMVLRPRDKRQIDLDNRIKAVLDALQNAGIFTDDWQVDFLQIARGEPVKHGAIYVTIESIDEVPTSPSVSAL